MLMSLLKSRTDIILCVCQVCVDWGVDYLIDMLHKSCIDCRQLNNINVLIERAFVGEMARRRGVSGVCLIWAPNVAVTHACMCNTHCVLCLCTVNNR